MKENNKKVYGVGINDADYVVSSKRGGKRIMCPYNQRWRNMLNRCYSKKFQKDNPTYKGCSVCKEWLTFSGFKAWMEGQDWKGKQLDKDILGGSEKIYSPETCCFISQDLNKLIKPTTGKTSGLPVGVHWNKRDKKFISSIRRNGEKHHIGSFSDPDQAAQSFARERRGYLLLEASKQPEPIRSALIARAREIKYEMV